MMTMLKQGRAFGLGCLLATQNPVDLDYKALSNIGTWFLGRLQTERDKLRVLDGLEGAAGSQNAKFDRASMEKLISGLGNRVFLMNNVHEDASGAVPRALGDELSDRSAHPQPDQDADGPEARRIS